MSRFLKFAVAGAALLLVYIQYAVFMRMYHLPTSSMANTIWPGNRVLASAVFLDIARNDILVFSYPPDPGVVYVSRCMGLPGEKIQIRNRAVLINNQPVPDPAQAKFAYLVDSKQPLPKAFFKRKGYGDDFFELPDGRYLVHLTPSQAAGLAELDFIREVEAGTGSALLAHDSCFPQSPAFPWSADNFGPLVIPREGWQVELTPGNVQLYGKCIRNYEGLEGITLEKDVLYQHGRPVTSHTFNQNYYFMMGDNRNNALDSRYWGFLPRDHVQRKVWWHSEPLL
jgi:signal peptidase I